MRNGTRFFPDHDEFYWNVTGNDWPVPIDHASATVRLPEAAAGSLRAQAFTGVYGSTQRDATARSQGRRGSVRDQQSRCPCAAGLTIDVYIPKGILKEPGALTKFFWFLGGNPIVFLPLVTFAGMFILWWYKGRDPDPGMSVAPMYEPPPGISPAEAGTLLDDSIHPRDITSTIVDLAVRGYIKIEETAEKVLLFTQRDYVFHLLEAAGAVGRGSGSARARHAGEYLRRRDRHSALQPEEPLLQRRSGDPPGHYGGAQEQGNLSARSGFGQRVQRGCCNRHFDSVRDSAVYGLGKLLQFRSAADRLHSSSLS